MTLNSVGGSRGSHGPSGRLLLFTEVSANVNLLAIGYPEVTFDIVRLTFGLLFVSFTKALRYTYFDSYCIHDEFLFKRV